MPLKYSNNRAKKVKKNLSRSKNGFRFSISSFSPKAIKNKIKYLFTTKEGLKKVGTGALIFFGLLLGIFGWYARDLPTPNKINARFAAQTTQILDRNGKLLYEIHGGQNRLLVKYDEIPRHIKDATVAIEDKNFYHHSGFSPVRIVGSAFNNLFRRAEGEGLEGGSTITQQFVKNALLSPEQTFDRKARELILAIQIEAMFSKEDILTMYLNEIPYGSNAYGVKVAARTFFDKELKDITLEEAAVLAALPQAPTFFSPYGNNMDALMARKDFVLQLMAEQGKITQEEADAAKKREIVFAQNPYGTIEAPHFVMHVKQKLVEKYGERMVNEGGLRVYTTLDKDLNDIANKAVQEIGARNATNFRASNASLVSVDPKTGQILAMVGSRDFFNQEIDGNVNVTTRTRQPGSSFKPFAYAALFKKENWGPGSIMYDVQTDFGGGYIPRNFDGTFRGNVTIRSSLQGSLNIPAVKALYIAGMNETLKTARDMGITTLGEADRYGLSLVLGSGEVRPIDMALAYGVFGNNGVKQELSWYVKIEDSSGKVLDQFEKRPGRQVIDPQVAYLINNTMADNNARAYIFGARSPLFVPGFEVASKTGTTDDNRDAWTVGYTPGLSTAVWAGNNDNSKMTAGGGATAAAPIWNAFMREALKKIPREEFTRPTGIKNVTLDAITGRQITEQTTSRIHDIFPSWYNVPLVNGQPIEVRIDRSTGKLATDKCPPELVETRIFSPIQAEIPKNDPAFARWNAPVLAWARGRGLNVDLDSIPTEKCPIHTGEDLPTIEIESPTENQRIGRRFNVVLSVSVPSGLDSISINADGISYTPTVQGNYYQAEVVFSSAGEKTIKVTVRDKISQTATKSIRVIVE